MHATVVVFPGSNADAEMIHTLRDVVGVHTDTAWHRDSELPAGVELVAIPGGFSYGDYLRCGAIARTSPIVGAIRRHVERGGWVLGVCNGFQILTEAGLLPGALTQNAQGRYQASDATLVELEAQGRVALRYCDATGAVTPAANPNGSRGNIAGIYGGPRRNVLGLMPHPERMSEPFQGGADGRSIFDAVTRAALAGAS